MLRLRVVSPAEQTDAALQILRDHVGATHLVLLRGAAVDPPGDLITADLAREAVDEIIGRLCDLDLDHTGGITLEVIDTSLSDHAVRAEEAAPGDGSDAIVWEELISRTGEESKPSWTFQAFLTIACLLAAVGIATDSPVTIVGAMVVGPEFGPLAAIAVGLVARRWDLLKRAVLALGIGFPAAMVITGVVGKIGELTGLFDRESLFPVDQPHQVDFIYQLSVYSLVVAMLAGAAGVLSLTSAKSAALVGVFISVTTVPAAGYAALAAVLGEWDRAGEALLQLAINLIGIVVAAALVLLIRRHKATDGVTTRPLSSG